VTDDTPTSTGQPTAQDHPSTAGSPSAQAETAAGLPERAAAIANERPEVAVGAAFGGGLLFALILKRFAR
jgi:hypothetical protein